MKIFEDEQGSEAWLHARLGIPTASNFKTVVSITKDAKDKKTRTEYMRKLAGEVITGTPMESYTNAHMQRGTDQEDEARSLYALMQDAEPLRVGFIRNYNAGCSPDSLIGDNGGLEIKSALPHIQIERLERNELPAEHRWQVQGGLWIADREWWDFVSYSPKLPLFVHRVKRDEECIKQIADAVAKFNDELAVLVAWLRSYGAKAAA